MAGRNSFTMLQVACRIKRGTQAHCRKHEHYLLSLSEQHFTLSRMAYSGHTLTLFFSGCIGNHVRQRWKLGRLSVQTCA